jgi:hypothetical protein
MPVPRRERADKHRDPARSLRACSEKTPGRLGPDLVFFDGEDYGGKGGRSNTCAGSRHFAVNLAGYRAAVAGSW